MLGYVNYKITILSIVMFSEKPLLRVLFLYIIPLSHLQFIFAIAIIFT